MDALKEVELLFLMLFLSCGENFAVLLRCCVPPTHYAFLWQEDLQLKRKKWAGESWELFIFFFFFFPSLCSAFLRAIELQSHTFRCTSTSLAGWLGALNWSEATPALWFDLSDGLSSDERESLLLPSKRVKLWLWYRLSKEAFWGKLKS